MKMLGQDLLTQEEFDNFKVNEYLVNNNQVNLRFNSVVDAYEKKIKHALMVAGVSVVTAVVALIIAIAK